jgi:hypothetical protein
MGVNNRSKKMVEKSAENDESEYSRLWNRSIRLATSALESAGIPDISTDNHEYREDRNFIFRVVKETNVFVYARIATRIGVVEINFSLARLAVHLDSLYKALLEPKAGLNLLSYRVRKQIENRKLDILSILNAQPEDSNDVIEDLVSKTLGTFLLNVPIMAEAAIMDSYGFAEVALFQHVLRPALREHWVNLGLPRTFNLISERDLIESRRRVIDSKRWFLGDKRSQLNTVELPKEAASLLPLYRELKREFKLFQKDFHNKNRRGTRKKLIAEWDEYWPDLFPLASAGAVDELVGNKERLPSQIVVFHLAHKYGYSFDRMYKLLSGARKRSAKAHLEKTVQPKDSSTRTIRSKQ